MSSARAGGQARTRLALGAGKLASLASRVSRRGGGTALPGLVATALAPDLVRDLTAQLAHGTVVVSGTNGKTTTARMLATVARSAGYRPVRNRSGSNLMRGLASSLMDESDLRGNLRDRECTLGIFEIDEATLPQALQHVTPSILLLLDLFRDQLDRYGEVATVARLWSAALTSLPPSTTVIANADDPLVTQVVRSAVGSPLFFGIEVANGGLEDREHASDVKACPACGGPIEYSLRLLGHLGHYRCSRCGFSRPETLSIWATDVQLSGVEGSQFTLRTRQSEAPVALPLPGTYNVYNALAAAAAGLALGRAVSDLASALQTVTPAFGRMERLRVGDRDVLLALAKNPTGLNEVLRALVADPAPLHLLMMLNDNTADGKDVSWIWDADVEMLRGRVTTAVFSGTRAYDMALRFKYAGIFEGPDQPGYEIVLDTEAALTRAVSMTPAGGRLSIVPTYTAMLDARSALARRGHVRPYWEE